MNIKCPKCSTEIPIQLEQHIPDSQVFSVRLTSECELFDAKTVGEMIVNTVNLLKAVADNIGTPVGVVVKGVDLKPNEITITFLITVVKAK